PLPTRAAASRPVTSGRGWRFRERGYILPVKIASSQRDWKTVDRPVLPAGVAPSHSKRAADKEAGARRTPMRHRLTRALLAALLVLLGVSVVAPAPARAEGVVEFSAGITAGSFPLDIVTGSDGNLWFTENGIDRIGRINPGTGQVDEFSAG